MDERLERVIGERLDAGDCAGAVEQAITGYGPEILGYLIARLRDRTLADEAYGNFAEALVKWIAGYERTCAFRTWAYVIARREALRVRKASRWVLVGDSQLQAIAAPFASTRPSYLETSARARLAAIRAALSDDERELLVLRVDRKLPWSEIALIVSPAGAPLTVASCRKRFHRLLQKLRVLYARASQAAPAH